MKRNACQKCAFAVRDDNPHCGLRGFTSSFNVEWCESENDKAPNGYELQEDGYFSWVKKKKEYPKSFGECCKVLGTYSYNQSIAGYKNELFSALQKLYICRDAYWKIAGDVMGLGKPWEPDWTSFEPKYIIYYESDGICFDEVMSTNTFLAFPTEEMRDAFYENFKELIDECKELL